MYKKFKIDEKLMVKKLQNQKEQRKISSLTIEIHKKQKNEISPIRSIILKRLEDV